VSGDARVSGDAWVSGDARVSGDAQVYGNAQVYGDARVSGDADLLIIAPIGSRNDTLTFTKSDNSAATGCFRGTIDEFEKQVISVNGDNIHAKVYLAAIAMAKTLFS
jgi:hypothetical protein